MLMVFVCLHPVFNVIDSDHYHESWTNYQRKQFTDIGRSVDHLFAEQLKQVRRRAGCNRNIDSTWDKKSWLLPEIGQIEMKKPHEVE